MALIDLSVHDPKSGSAYSQLGLVKQLTGRATYPWYPQAASIWCGSRTSQGTTSSTPELPLELNDTPTGPAGSTR